MRAVWWIAVGAVTSVFPADAVGRGAAASEQEFGAGTCQPMPNVLGVPRAVVGDPGLVQWLLHVRGGLGWSHNAPRPLLKLSQILLAFPFSISQAASQ